MGLKWIEQSLIFKLAFHMKKIVLRTLLKTIDTLLEFPDFSRGGKEARYFNMDISANRCLDKGSRRINLLVFKTKEKWS